MIWEWIATIFAGMGAAGIMLGLRFIFKKMPKWLIPAGAGAGMLFFQIYSEYTWYGHTRSLLPQKMVVIAEIADTAPYKPWTYVQPQILKFVAVDTAKTLSFDNVVQANLYFFERRMSARTWPVLIDCETRLQANIKGASNNTPVADKWYAGDYTGKIADAVCR